MTRALRSTLLKEICLLKTSHQVQLFVTERSKDLGLTCELEEGYCNTDRKIPGTRLRHPGKGRTGARLKMYVPNGDRYPTGFPRPVLDHNNAETYRHLGEVREWLCDWVQKLPNT